MRDYRGLIFSLSILLVCILGFLFGIVPVAQQVINRAESLSSRTKDLNALKMKISVLQGIDENTLRTDLQTLLSAVPSDKSLATLLTTVDNLTAQTGVSVGSLSLTKPGSLSTASASQLTEDEKQVGSNILPFAVSVSGTFDQIRTFLSTASLVRRLFRVRTFNISFQDNNIVSTIVTLNAFYFPLPSTIGPVIQPVTLLSGADTDTVAKVESLRLLTGSMSPLPPPSSGPAKSDPFSL